MTRAATIFTEKYTNAGTTTCLGLFGYDQGPSGGGGGAQERWLGQTRTAKHFCLSLSLSLSLSEISGVKPFRLAATGIIEHHCSGVANFTTTTRARALTATLAMGQVAEQFVL